MNKGLNEQIKFYTITPFNLQRGISMKFEDLTQEDFGRELDPELFAKWKVLKKEQQSQVKKNLIFWVAAFAALLILGGIIGLIIFFGLMLTSILKMTPKNKAAADCQANLGVTQKEVNEALVALRKRQS